MVTATRTTDDKARISLPGGFANCTVLMEQVSETEVRIRKARVIPEDDIPFVEESMTPLSDRDRDLFLALLDDPPLPNEALKRLMSNGSNTTVKRGRLEELYGHPKTAVFLWMGKNGWTIEEALKVVHHFGIKTTDASLKTFLRAGAKGERGEPAEITAEQADEMSAIAGKTSGKSKK